MLGRIGEHGDGRREESPRKLFASLKRRRRKKERKMKGKKKKKKRKGAQVFVLDF